jgi:predicted flavoprotein YhiN
VLAPERFVTDSPPHLMRGMLRAWPLPRMVHFFENDVGVPLALEADTGKLFPRSNRARDVRDGLVTLAGRRGVGLRFHTSMEGLTSNGAGWEIATTTGVIRASRVILATGGLSVPATGSDGLGLTLARTLGHRVHEPYAALTPLTFDADRHPLEPHAAVGTPHPALGTPHPAPHPAPRTPHSAPHSAPCTLHPAPLSGLSLPVRLRARSDGRTAETTGGFLFTHRGYSGPAVLDISHVCVRSEGGARAQLRVAWSTTTAAEWEARLLSGDRGVATVVAGELPERLGLALMASAAIPRDRRTSALTRAERLELVTQLTACRLPWTGHEGYKKAEVTGGGIALDEVNPVTLESRRCPGLFFCGEILDAFGPIGGHNFAWAWATGHAVGTAAAGS